MCWVCKGADGFDKGDVGVFETGYQVPSCCRVGVERGGSGEGCIVCAAEVEEEERRDVGLEHPRVSKVGRGGWATVPC
jgi:hypothetical protein